MRQQPRSSQTAIHGPCGRRRLYDTRAACATQLGADVADDQETSGYVLQHLRDIFAQFAQFAAALRAIFLVGKMGMDFPPEMRGQGAPLDGGGKSRLGGSLLRWLHSLLGANGLQAFELEFQLLDLPGHLLRLASE